MLLGFVSAIILAVLLHLNYALYYQPKFIKVDGAEVNEDVYRQLNFLEQAIHQGAAEDMQGVYPEGYIFMNALYTLTWADFAGHLNHQSALYHRAHSEMQWSLSHMSSAQGRSIFESNLPIPYGAFYTGWTSYALGKKLALENPEARDTSEVALFERQCHKIAAFVNGSKTPYAESYRGNAWPADMTVGIASLALHDKIFTPQFDNTVHHWINGVKENLDSNGLMPHAANIYTGKPLQGARGSSLSLMLNFLWEIDRPFAQQQFAIYQKLFLVNRLGLPAIREYPAGTSGSGDSDSGPVIWGVGGSASIVGLRVMALYGAETEATGLRNSIEGFGAVTKPTDQKKFLFGVLPMADGFIAWANATESLPQGALQSSSSWRLGFQFFSFVTLILIALLWFYSSGQQKQLSQRNNNY